MLSRTDVVAGNWKISSFKVNGVEDHIALSIQKIFRDGCDTQLIYHRDSLVASYIVLGENEKAINLLKKSAESGGFIKLFLKNDYNLDPLRQNAEFAGLID